MSIRVFIYDDDLNRSDSLKSLIQLSDEVLYVGCAPNCVHIEENMNSTYPDVVLMDINMPDVNGIEGLKIIKKQYHKIKVLIQTAFDDSSNIFECIKNGASGYILKTDGPNQILQAIMEVYEGGAAINPGVAKKLIQYFQPNPKIHELSSKEYEVLECLAEGLSYKMTADRMGISYNTVNTHTKKIYEKLHISSLGEAISFYYKNLK
ncbi:MAG: response regulator [Leadbetterella sp.]